MNRNGMIFTSFAILSSALLLTLVFIPFDSTSPELGSDEINRIGEASFYLESIENDVSRTLEMSTRRATIGLADYIVQEGEAVEDSDDAYSSIMSDGTYMDNEINSMENASLQDWIGRVSSVSEGTGYEVSLDVDKVEITGESMDSIETTSKVNITLIDPATSVRFDTTKESSSQASIEGVEDSMLVLRSEGRYVSQYNFCGFEQPAENLELDGEGDAEAHGEAVVNPSDLETIENKEEKILVTDDVNDYGEAANDFNGVVSVSQPNDMIYDNIVYNVETISSIGENLILSGDQVWNSNFGEIIENDCYIPSSDGPGYIDRLENNIDGTGGMATFIDITELPLELRQQDSAVGYVYFNSSDTYGDIHQLTGVSDTYNWFYLDEYHVQKWGLEDLT